MIRTLSARILLGFAALTLAFGVTTATVVRNMTKVEEQISLLRAAYVPLAIEGKNLELTERDLKAYLDALVDDEGGPNGARANLNRVQPARDKALEHFANGFAEIEKLPTSNPREFEVTRKRLASLVAATKDAVPIYQKMRSALIHATSTLDTPEITALRDELRSREIEIYAATTELSTSLSNTVRFRSLQLEEREQGTRRTTIYLGIVATVFALLITIWVLITLRPLRRLRDAARLVASGRYDSRIPENGPAEVADLARELNAMARAIEERERELVRSERLAAIGKMSAVITHEVRNPLSAIGLNTELLEDELGNASPEAREVFRAIQHEVDRLTAITEDYLQFARLPKPKLAPEAINTLVGAAASFLREDLATRKVALELDLGPGDPIALIDAAQIRQCLINLLRNAADAVVAKGGGRVTLRTRRIEDRITVDVADEGVGIPQEVLSKLFDPFFSTKDGGNGLGLALTQQIVRDHGGDITVESTVGKGTTFTLSVPAGNMAGR
jgi:two-component system NtrC family sensor kinase